MAVGLGSVGGWQGDLLWSQATVAWRASPSYFAFFLFHLFQRRTLSCLLKEAIMEKLEQNKLDRVPFVTTYNPPLPNIPKLLQESQTILNASEKCSEVFKNTPLVSCRRGRNLNDMLCSKRTPQQKHTNQRNKYSQDVNNKSEKESQPKTNQCPECGILLKNEKGLKINCSSKLTQTTAK